MEKLIEAYKQNLIEDQSISLETLRSYVYSAVQFHGFLLSEGIYLDLGQQPVEITRQTVTAYLESLAKVAPDRARRAVRREAIKSFLKFLLAERRSWEGKTR